MAAGPEAEKSGLANGIVCQCLGITEKVLVDAITGRKLQSVREVIQCTGAGGGCTACHRVIRRFIERG